MAERIFAEWPAPAGIRAFTTTRDEDLAALGPELPSEPLWLKQVHGARCVRLDSATAGEEADASVAGSPGAVCAIRTADCLPVLFCDEAGTVVGAAHAGWRGLAGGVLEATVRTLGVPGDRLLAWLGPAIGPAAFEVGADVREAFLAGDAGAASAFASRGEDKWLCDLYALARRRLAALGVERVFGGGFCTFGEPERFFSYRRSRDAGRMVSLIWIE